MTKRTTPEKAAVPSNPPPKPLSARTVRKHLAALPDWQAVGGNQELVGRFRVPDLPGAVIAVTAALGLAETWSGHTRVECSGLEVIVHFTTPAAGGVTRNDLRLAERFSEHQRRFARPADWRAALQETAGMWKDREDLPDLDALRREWDRQPEETRDAEKEGP